MSCGRTRVRMERFQKLEVLRQEKSQKNENLRSTEEYNGVSLRKEDFMSVVVTVRLL
jgi:hypothetical protein